MSTSEEVAAPPWLAPTPGGVGALTSWTAADGRPRVASAGSDGTIRVWDPELGTMVASLPTSDDGSQHNATVLRLAVWTGAGGSLLAAASETGSLQVWDVDAAEPSLTQLVGHDGWIQALTFWADDRHRPRLASGGGDRTVRVWDPVTGEQLPALPTGTRKLAALASYPESGVTRLVVADESGDITVWDPDRHLQMSTPVMHHDGGLWTLATWRAGDGTPRFASGGYDGTVRAWNPQTGQETTPTMRGHGNWVGALSVLDGGARLVSASTDGTVRIWNAETGVPVGSPLTVARTSIALAALAVWSTTDGRHRLAVAAEGGAIRSFDPDTLRPWGEPMIGHVAGMWALASWHDAGGTLLARGGDDGFVRIWNADTGQTVGTPLAGHTAAVWGLVRWTHPDGRTMLASTGDDGTIRTWDVAASTAEGGPMTGHVGWVPGLTTWHRPDGTVALASAGRDGTVRLWDPVTRQQLGEPLRGHAGWALTVVEWPAPQGVRLISGGDDGTIRLWDPVAGTPVGEPLRGHSSWARSIVLWQDSGRTLMVSGGYDGAIRVWDARTWTPISSPLLGHRGRVGALAAWTSPGGGARLASAGDDGLIHLWNLDTLRPMGEPLTGHTAGIWALTSWTDHAGDLRLASAGHDGSVRLWDPETGHAVRTIEIGPVAMWGLSDAPLMTDVIGRQPLADAIADQLLRPHTGMDPLYDDGPTVVSVEGPWGCGKSTLMNLVRVRLPAVNPHPPPQQSKRRLTVRDVLRQIRRHVSRSPTPAATTTTASAMVTAWFNPWAYQSGEQVWAGLANEIIEAAARVLYRDEADRERYWLSRNLGRIDRYALRRALYQRTRSPLLGFGIAALIAPLAVSIALFDKPIELLGLSVSPLLVAVGLTTSVVIGGVVHTSWRRWFGKAVTYMPSELLTGPVADFAAIDEPVAQPESDPLRRALTGALYLHQHNIGDLVDDLAAAGYGLVVFVDDIDRCRPGTIAEVFEAVNLFLTNVATRSGLRAHFVIGLDSAVVARHLDAMYSEQPAASYGDDPTPGWAFLRKLIQLPIIVPHVPDAGIQLLVDSLTQPAAAPPASFPPRPAAQPAVSSDRRASPAPSAPSAPRRVPLTRTPVDTFTWRSAEAHPEVRDLLVRRLSAQPQRSIREAKRMINLWQFYERILEAMAPTSQPELMVIRARRLLILAEIITRWPALQGRLHRYVEGQRGLQLLAMAADSDEAWADALDRLRLPETQATHNLRILLRDNDGSAVADLAAFLI